MINFAELEEKLGLGFENTNLILQALTHSSYAKQKGSSAVFHNERLEFLGDAVLKLIMSDYLYHHYPKYHEGELTKKRAALISDKVLFEIGNSLKIGKYLRLSNSEKRTGGHEKPSNVANAMEAILGAIYLDSGLESARSFFIKKFESLSDQLPSIILNDYKTLLQEKMQKLKHSLPDYHVHKEEGPEHEKAFFVEVRIEYKSRHFSCIGKGKSKKEAEQMAARQVLEELEKSE
jgi:ribonuclease-3